MDGAVLLALFRRVEFPITEPAEFANIQCLSLPRNPINHPQPPMFNLREGIEISVLCNA